MSDALTDILRSVRMEGSVFSRAALSAPWGIESGTLPTGIFHAVVSGRAWATLASGGPTIELERGDVVMMPFGDNHLMTNEPGSSTQLIRDINKVDSRGMGHLIVEGGGPQTSLICGTVSFEADLAHPVFSMLPPMVHVRDHDGRLSSVVETMIGLIANEVDQPGAGAETVVARLTDVLIVYVLRSYIDRLPAGEGGWLGALNDPPIRDTLGLIHRQPERPWTAKDLAAAVGMSRSAFFARFRESVGETPTQYLTRWRVHLAIRLLKESDSSVASVAQLVGYGTEAAFSNAFKRITGVRPGAFRRAA